MLLCQGLQRLQSVIYKQQSLGILRVAVQYILTVDNGSRSTLLQRLHSVVVAIERCPVQCKKERTDLDFPRVGSYAR